MFIQRVNGLTIITNEDKSIYKILDSDGKEINYKEEREPTDGRELLRDRSNNTVIGTSRTLNW